MYREFIFHDAVDISLGHIYLVVSAYIFHAAIRTVEWHLCRV